MAKGKTVLMFSYGSGLASTLFSLKCVGPTGHIAQAANLRERLDSRKFVTPKEFNEALTDRETKYGKFGWQPESDPSQLYPGTYHLQKVPAPHPMLSSKACLTFMSHISRRPRESLLAHASLTRSTDADRWTSTGGGRTRAPPCRRRAFPSTMGGKPSTLACQARAVCTAWGGAVWCGRGSGQCQLATKGRRRREPSNCKSECSCRTRPSAFS